MYSKQGVERNAFAVEILTYGECLMHLEYAHQGVNILVVDGNRVFTIDNESDPDFSIVVRDY